MISDRKEKDKLKTDKDGPYAPISIPLDLQQSSKVKSEKEEGRGT